MVARITVELIVIALAAWFWPHCARPALAARQAAPLAYWIILGLTVLVAAANGFAIAGEIAMTGAWASWWATTIAGGLYMVVVGLGYFQDYALLLRLTGKGHRRRSKLV